MFKKSVLFFILIIFAFNYSFAVLPDKSNHSLLNILNPDGPLVLKDGINGNIDISGYQMLISADGPPRSFPSADSFISSKTAEWTWDDQFYGPGFDREVLAFAFHNGGLYASGSFKYIEGKEVNRIARWDGSEWHPLGTGMNNGVSSLVVLNGDIYAGGWFTTAGGTEADRVARWDGSEWHSLGTGPSSTVSTLAVHNGDLYAGGTFLTAGGTEVNRIARWDGSEWHPLGTGMNGNVSSLAVYNGCLYAGGSFTIAGETEVNRIARWDGSEWHSLETGVNGSVFSLAVHNDGLYAGGSFTSTGGTDANRIARWDGSEWHSLETGVNSIVYTLAVYNGDLYAGGIFTSAGETEANRIARWDGTEWHPLGIGVNNGVRAIADYNGTLYVGGWFSTAGGIEANRIALWDGTEWYPQIIYDDWEGKGMNGGVLALAVHNTDLYAGGAFETAGGIEVNYIARWDGSEWHALGNGMSSTVYALALYNGDLYAGGEFLSAGGNEVNYIARWDGTQWHALGSGMNSTVYALAVYNGNLYAGGYFTTAGETEANRTARWDGTEWHSLGAGISSTVYALTVYNGDLYAGGYFTTAGETEANSIAQWDGSEWHSLGAGMGRTVYALAVYNDELYAGGAFTTAGETEANRIARWDGTEWHSLGTGIGWMLADNVSALAVYNGDLYAGGYFTSAGEIQAGMTARWDGTEWYSLKTGVNEMVHALAVYNDDLYAGGWFTNAGAFDSRYIARWYRMENYYKVDLQAFPEYIEAIFTGDGYYEVGDTVNISVELIKEYAFQHWTGSPEDLALLGDDLTSPSAFFVMPARDIEFTAVFEWDGPPLEEWSVTLFSDPNSPDIILSGAGNYQEGDTVIISASINKSWTFLNWHSYITLDMELLSDPYSALTSFTMPARDIEFTAVFEWDGPPVEDPRASALISIARPDFKGIWKWDFNASKSSTINEKIFEWVPLYSGLTASKMMAGDINGNGALEFVCIFDDYGLFYYNQSTNSWNTVISIETIDFTLARTGPLSRKQIIASFPFGLYVYSYETRSWLRIIYHSADSLHSVNFDRNEAGIDQLFVTFVDIDRMYLYDFELNQWATLVFAKPSEILRGDITGDGYDEIICSFEDFGMFIFRYIPDKDINFKTLFDKYQAFDINKIFTNEAWVSKNNDNKGMQIKKISHSSADLDHQMILADITGDSNQELVSTFNGVSYYYSYHTESFSGLINMPLRRIASGRFTGNNSNDLIACISETGDIYLIVTNNGNTEVELLLQNGFSESILAIHSLAPSIPVAPLQKTGQTEVYRDGDDGYYKKGVEWPDPRFTDHGNGTVTDNLTGLMWTRDANLALGMMTWQGAIDWCNVLDLADYNDWRLPNIRELLSLSDISEYNGVLPSGHPFLNVQEPENDEYWSSTTYSADTDNAWIIRIGSWGFMWHRDKSELRHVWAVRGESDGVAPVSRTGQTESHTAFDDGFYQKGIEWPVPRWTDHGDNTVTDNLTGLMWTKSANMALDYPNTDYPSINGRLNWNNAIDYCYDLVHAEYSDWRLPNLREILSLVNFEEHDIAFPSDNPFVNIQSSHYWSSSTNAQFSDDAWFVLMNDGHARSPSKNSSIFVWPVRAGQ